MWIITRDLLFEESALTQKKSEVGNKSKDLKLGCRVFFNFRLLDDDGVVYYYGLSDSCDGDNSFEPLDYYMNHSGCTEIQYEIHDQWKTL